MVGLDQGLLRDCRACQLDHRLTFRTEKHEKTHRRAIDKEIIVLGGEGEEEEDVNVLVEQLGYLVSSTE